MNANAFVMPLVFVFGSIGFYLLMSWVLRSFLKGFFATIFAPIALIAAGLLVSIPFTFMGEFLSIFWAKEYKEAVVEAVVKGGVATTMFSILIWFCCSMRHVSSIEAHCRVASHHRSHSERCGNPLRRKFTW